MGEAFGAEDVDGGAADCDSGGDEEAPDGFAAIDEDEGESGDGEEGRQGIERDAEGAREIGLLYAEDHDADVLKEELQQDAGDDQHGDDLLEAEEAEERSDEAEGDEGAVGDSVAGMDSGEEAEVVAALRGGERDARVSEKKREDGGEGGPHDEGGDGVSGPLTEGGARDLSY